MNSSTTVKNQYLADTFRKVSQIVARRPVSHLAAATFLATHVHVAHEGLMSALPSSLGWSLTGLVVAIATLQWLAHGRHEACLAERDHGDRQSADPQRGKSDHHTHHGGHQGGDGEDEEDARDMRKALARDPKKLSMVPYPGGTIHPHELHDSL